MPHRFQVILLGTAIVALIGTQGQMAEAQPGSVSPTLVKLTRTSTATPVAADWITFTGSTTTAAKGRPITLQRRGSTGGWKSAFTASVKKTGAFSFRTRATGVGRFSYRASISAFNGHAAGTSPSRSVTVSRWYYLSDQQRVASDGYGGSGSATIAGTTYFHSVLVAGRTSSHWVEYNTSYKCSTLRATIGVVDSARSSGVIHDSVLADSTSLGTSDVPLGKSAPIQYDVTGVFRLRLQTDFAFPAIAAGYTAQAGWGDARVLCSGQP